jgi:hypothetical protein
LDISVILWNLADLTLDSLMQDACAWAGDYLKNKPDDPDRPLCDDISPQK